MQAVEPLGSAQPGFLGWPITMPELSAHVRACLLDGGATESFRWLQAIGIGREMGAEGVEAYLETRTIVQPVG